MLDLTPSLIRTCTNVRLDPVAVTPSLTPSLTQFG
ncbi:hypothetical protein JOD97_001531 [Duganella sp. 1411]|jgi:hypothetical protein|nr:hypothetical protein [Duganella sp. 1411]